ncbi:MAG: UDP-glucose/GDP-mannose dehydrogenase family protein [Micrococcaceae bacterium]
MKISVIGCGYLGAVHAACMASLGHHVIGLDVDEKKIDSLKKGQAPFFEPQLQDLLKSGVASGNLEFTTDPQKISDSEVHFIGVGTPQKSDSEAADLTYVNAAVDTITQHAPQDSVIVGKSTVPVGTAATLEKKINKKRPDISLVWNPEFLREGYAVKDTLHPDRLVYGVSQDSQKASFSEQQLDQVYQSYLEQEIEKIVTDYATAELVKVSANSFLATKISFINAVAEVCEATGANVVTLAHAIGLDDRIGKKFLKAGIGFGGGCLPKDIRGFKARVEELGIEGPKNLLAEVDVINTRARTRAAELAQNLVKKNKKAKIAALGVAFKADSDDLRDSPALDIAQSLSEDGYTLSVYDPEANEEATKILTKAGFATSAEEAVKDADLILVGTEWKEFREADPKEWKKLVKTPVILDGRNCLDQQDWEQAGFTYHGLGNIAR